MDVVSAVLDNVGEAVTLAEGDGMKHIVDYEMQRYWDRYVN